MTVTLLTLGSATVDVAIHMPMEPERGQYYTAPIASYLIRGKGKIILVDTGLSPEHLSNSQARSTEPEMIIRMTEEDVVTARLGSLGVSLDDIDAVIATHFDFDHCGGNRLITKPPYYVQRDHMEFARDHPDRCFSEDWNDSRIEYRLVEGDIEVVPDITLIATPGHVPGHQSVAVQLGSGRSLLIAADAALTHRMYDEELVEGTLDPAASLESIHKLKSYRSRHQSELIVGHDAEAWQSRYRIPPAYYD